MSQIRLHFKKKKNPSILFITRYSLARLDALSTNTCAAELQSCRGLTNAGGICSSDKSRSSLPNAICNATKFGDMVTKSSALQNSITFSDQQPRREGGKPEKKWLLMKLTLAIGEHAANRKNSYTESLVELIPHVAKVPRAGDQPHRTATILNAHKV